MEGYEAFEAPAARLEVEPEARLHLDLASRGARLGANLLNGLIAGGLVLIGVVVAIPARSRVWVLVYMAMALLGVAIWNMVLIHKHGQTLGKRIVGIRMVRSDGSRVSLGRVIGLRILPVYVMQLIPFIGPFVSLADVLFVFRDSRKCIHDNLADTIVVNA